MLGLVPSIVLSQIRPDTSGIEVVLRRFMGNNGSLLVAADALEETQNIPQLGDSRADSPQLLGYQPRGTLANPKKTVYNRITSFKPLCYDQNWSSRAGSAMLTLVFKTALFF